MNNCLILYCKDYIFIDMIKKHYDNIRIHDPNDMLIGYCNKDRCEWYLKKGIVIKIDDKTVKLLFPPKKMMFKKILIEKEDKCVACGNEENLTLVHVVPLCFKKLFPISLKSHISSDIVLLCANHTSDASAYNDILKKELFDAVNISKDMFVDNTKKSIKYFAKQLIKNPQVIKSVKKLSKLLNKFETEICNLSQDELQKMTELDANNIIDGCNNIFEYYIKIVLKNDEEKIKQLIIDHKKNFVDNLDPKYLYEDYYAEFY